MTEAEWLTTEMALYMLRQYPAKWSGRKACLVACCCLRSHPLFSTDALTRQYVEIVEATAEGEVDQESWWLLWKAICAAAVQEYDCGRYDLLHTLIPTPNRDALIALFTGCRPLSDDTETIIAQCNSLRDIFGNPFRPVTLSPRWRTDTSVSLARQMYESRDFSAMPILADTLQDAECDNADILSHCRDANQLHVRGCWVVDLVLGKE